MRAIIKTFPCRNRGNYGDCIFLILRDDENADSFHIMIDCGALSDDIRQFILGELGNRIDLIIATHIDCDHIDGITAIFNDRDLADLHVGKIVYNCYRRPTDAVSIMLPTQTNNRIRSFIASQPIDCGTKVSFNTSVSLIAKILEEENLKPLLHPQTITDLSPNLQLGEKWGELVFLSPTEEALDDLYSEFREKFACLTSVRIPDTPFEGMEETYEMLLKISKEIKPFVGKKMRGTSDIISEQDYLFASRSDPNENSLSFANKASIAFMWENGEHRILFMGDAMCETVKQSLLRKKGIRDGEILYFDAIKVSHHGSKYSTSEELMQIVDAPVYFIAGGSLKEERPSIDAISKITTRPLTRYHCRQLRYNLPTELIKKLCLPVNQGLREKYKFEIIDDTLNPTYEFEY